MPLKTGFVVQGSHIIIISEGWCDTEDCINGWWKCSFACQHRNKLHFKIYLNKKTVILSKSNISQKHSFKNIFNKYLVKYVCMYLFIYYTQRSRQQSDSCLSVSLSPPVFPPLFSPEANSSSSGGSSIGIPNWPCTRRHLLWSYKFIGA